MKSPDIEKAILAIYDVKQENWDEFMRCFVNRFRHSLYDRD